MKSNNPEDKINKFFKRNYLSIKKWFFWFRKEHKIEKEKELFAWHSSFTANGVDFLASGLDDYPRS